MSLQGFQSALASVIRAYDAHETNNINELALSYELTHDEKLTLENLINQQRLKAYSEELFLSRWTIIRDALEFLSPFVDLKAMSDFWEKNFEPKSKAVVYEDLALKFVEYLAYDPVGLKFITTNTPAFMASLMRYVHAVFTFRHNVLPIMTLSPHSLLTGRYFAVLTLDHDVREFFADLMEVENFKDVNLQDPPALKTTLLFIADDEITEFRSFEIDDELHTFLLKQLNGEITGTPACYQDLVDAGLCKPMGKKRACCDQHHD
jgi:hypothetical protein